jgi:hypothetical protein
MCFKNLFKIVSFSSLLKILYEFFQTVKAFLNISYND